MKKTDVQTMTCGAASVDEYTGTMHITWIDKVIVTVKKAFAKK